MTESEFSHAVAHRPEMQFAAVQSCSRLRGTPALPSDPAGARRGSGFGGEEEGGSATAARLAGGRGLDVQPRCHLRCVRLRQLPLSNPKPEQPSGDLSDNWSEGSIKAGARRGVHDRDSSAQLYGKVSGVGERTFGAAPPLVGDDASSFDVEDLYIGWRSGNSLGGLGENALDFTVGRTQYKLGHGMLLYDGAAEGGSRGGYWTNARKAFEFAAIGRFKPGNHTIEAFYLDKDELPESDSRQQALGRELRIRDRRGHDARRHVHEVVGECRRGAAARRSRCLQPARLHGAVPEPEGAVLRAGVRAGRQWRALDSTAWNALVAYQFDMTWKPKLSYRYAFFEGDDPRTAENEAFDGLFTGFYDWSTWWQGEIAGEYFISNSNLISHQLRLHAKPTEAISTGLIFFDFLLDHPESFGPLVTSDDVAHGARLVHGLDASTTTSSSASWPQSRSPGDAVEQSSGRTDTFFYGMIFAAYSF